jgi:hypothetical protein
MEKRWNKSGAQQKPSCPGGTQRSGQLRPRLFKGHPRRIRSSRAYVTANPSSRSQPQAWHGPELVSRSMPSAAPQRWQIDRRRGHRGGRAHRARRAWFAEHTRQVNQAWRAIGGPPTARAVAVGEARCLIWLILPGNGSPAGRFPPPLGSCKADIRQMANSLRELQGGRLFGAGGQASQIPAFCRTMHSQICHGDSCRE